MFVYGIKMETERNTFWNFQKLSYKQEILLMALLILKWWTLKVNHSKQRKSIKFKINIFVWYSQPSCLQISRIVLA